MRILRHKIWARPRAFDACNSRIVAAGIAPTPEASAEVAMLKYELSELSPLQERIGDCRRQLTALEVMAFAIKQERTELDKKEADNAAEQQRVAASLKAALEERAHAAPPPTDGVSHTRPSRQ